MILVGSELMRLLDSTAERINTSYHLRDRSRDLLEKTRARMALSQARIEYATSTLASVSDHALTAIQAASEKHVPKSSPPSGELMQIVSDCDMEDQIVVMDGKHFKNCNLINCTLMYSGLPMLIESTSFSKCRFRFADSAALTLQFLKCFEIVPESSKGVTLASQKLQEQSRPN